MKQEGMATHNLVDRNFPAAIPIRVIDVILVAVVRDRCCRQINKQSPNRRMRMRVWPIVISTAVSHRQCEKCVQLTIRYCYSGIESNRVFSMSVKRE